MAFILLFGAANASSFDDLLGIAPTPSPEICALPDINQIMGQASAPREGDYTPSGYKGARYRYDFEDLSLAKAHAEALYLALLDAGFQAQGVTVENFACILFTKNAARVLLIPMLDTGHVSVILCEGAQYALPSSEEAAYAQPALPDFGAFIGWTPSERRQVFATGADGTQYYYDIYYGYVECVAREYADLLEDARFRLRAVVKNAITQNENGIALESGYLYEGPEDLGEGLPTGQADNMHVYLCANSGENVMMLVVYPEEFALSDTGDRSAWYGQFQRGAPASHAQSGGSAQSQCALCKGTGVCYACGGAGAVYTVQGKQPCPSCANGSGVCKWCGGTGVY